MRIRVFSLAVAIALAAGTGTALAEDGTVDTPQVDSPASCQSGPIIGALDFRLVLGADAKDLGGHRSKSP